MATSGRGLLSRIGGRGRHSTSPPDEAASVLEHLRSLLNTRRGQAPSEPTFGLPDFTDLIHDFPSSMETLVREIRDTVLKFEPRLGRVTVQHLDDDDPLVLKFEISGRLVTEDRLVTLQTRILAGGKVDLV